jgi:hypothetical protein
VIAAQNIVEDKKLFITATSKTFIIAILMFAITFTLQTIYIQIILGAIIYITLRIKLLTQEELILVKKMPLGNKLI